MDYTQSGRKISVDKLIDLPGAIYVRVSLDDSKQDIESQREAVKAWCRLHNLTVPKSRIFEDSQGYTPRHKFDRPAFSRLETEVKAGRIKWVVVWNQKRFGGGDPWHYAAKIQDFREAGCQVWDIDGRCLSADDAYSFFEGGMKATSSRDEVLSRTKDSMRTKIDNARKGIYPGGFVPYACDIACIREDGSERWRLIIEGHHKRLQVYPDGRQERYDGRGSFPASQSGDTLYLRPSRDQSKIEVVRYVFETFAAEKVSTYQIARTLNKLGHKPTYSQSWQASHVEAILKNSVYIGRPSWSKNGQGQHLEYIDGEYQPVEKTHGRRWRPVEQHIMSDKPIFDPTTFIKMEVWEAVRAKMPCDDSVRPKRAPKSSDGWLAGLVYCKGCGLKMRGQQRPNYFQFSCYSYDKSRDTGDSRCARNSIAQTKIEEFLWRYLEETAQAATVLSRAAQAGDADMMATVPEGLSPLFDRLTDVTLKMMGVVKTPLSQVEAGALQDEADLEAAQSALGSGDLQTAQVVVDRAKARLRTEQADLLTAYRSAMGGSRSALESRRRELLAEFDSLKESLRRTTNARMLASLNADVERVATELDTLEAQLGDLEDDYLDAIRSINDFVETVKDSLRHREDKRPRVLAEEVSKIIDRIEIEFRPTGSKYPQSVPTSMTFIPKVGGKPVTNDVSG